MLKIVFISLLSFGYIFGATAQTNVENICSNCHGFKLHESAFGVSKVPNTLSSQEILKKLRAYKSGALDQYNMGATMTEQLANLNDQDLINLSEYVPTLK